MRRIAHALALAALIVATAQAGTRTALAGPKGRSKAPRAPVELRGAPIRDLPTLLSVPVDEDRSLVLRLPAGFWLRCPRHLPVPNSLDGKGVILHYLNARGGSVSMLYAGTVPLGAHEEGDAPDARSRRAAADFAATLSEKYARVGWTRQGGAVSTTPVKLKIAGRKSSAWRTSRYTTRPEDYAGPESTFSGECLLLHCEGTEVLAYVALDAKGGGTTLDAAIAGLDVRPTRALHPKGRRVQVNDLRESSEGRYPVRLMAFDMPPGFVPTPALWAVGGEWVYVEERLPAAGGPADAVLRIAGRRIDPSETSAQAAAELKSLWPEAGAEAPEPIDLSVEGHQAHAFSRPAPEEGADATAHVASLLLDDQLLTWTWISRSGDAAAQDRAQFLALLRSVEMAVRW